VRWLNGRGRATYSCSDQAPFSTGSDHCLTCRSRFIVDHPTLPQAVAISTPPPEKIVRTAPSRLRPAYPAAGLFAVPDTGSRFSRIVNHPHSPPGRLRYQFKAHSTFLPNRRGFLHCTVSKPPRPPPGYIPPTIIRCGRGGPDTVLTNIARHSTMPLLAGHRYSLGHHIPVTPSHGKYNPAHRDPLRCIADYTSSWLLNVAPLLRSSPRVFFC
jgi:hypothetical protein